MGEALPFPDRSAAGRALGAALRARLAGQQPVVLGLPRGGVPVAAAVAHALGAPLDVLVVRKLGAPGRGELAIGAVASGGVTVVDQDLVRRLRVSDDHLRRVLAAEREELARRELAYRGRSGVVPLTGRLVVLVDDGLATGASMQAALDAVRVTGPAQVVVAVPVGAPEACARLARTADDLVCLQAPTRFRAVGAHYTDFSQTSDGEVQRLLAAHGQR